MSTKSRFALVLLALRAVLAGCAKPPEPEIASAREQLAQAGEVAAETWAADEWSAAQAAMNAAEEEIATQAGKFALSRSYEQTSKLLVDAKAAAETARTAAVANKEAARNEASDAVAAAGGSLADAQAAAQALTECPRKPKGFDADMDITSASLAALAEEVAALQAHLNNERYSTATQEATDLTSEIGIIHADLQSVGEKIGCQPAAEN